ncbi:transmembrane protein 270 [Rhynchocyon petersi]
MEEEPLARSSLSGIVLQTIRLSVLLVQNRIHLHNFLLLKIILFNRWVSRLAQEAYGSCSRQVPPPPGDTAGPMRQAVRAGLTLLEIPVWLVLWVSKLVQGSVLGCAQALGLSSRRLDVWELVVPSSATWADLLVSCVHSLMLVVFLLVVVVWRLCWMAHRFSLSQLSRKCLLECCLVLRFLVWMKRLYCWVKSMVSLTSWHLIYLITWTTCLASHLLQAAFDHTTQLAQEIELQEASWTLLKTPIPESLTPEAGPALSEPETPRE